MQILFYMMFPVAKLEKEVNCSPQTLSSLPALEKYQNETVTITLKGNE